MINFIKEWVIDIVTMFIFVSLLEIILPNSNMKRFIDMIIGFLIIIVIINPFIKLLFKDIDIERNVFANMTRFNNEYNQDVEDENILELQQNQITNVYIKKIENDVATLVEENSEYEIVDVNLQIEEDMESENYGKIEEMDLVLDIKDESSEKDKSNIRIDEVEEVSVKWSRKNKLEGDTFSDSEKIKALISKNYSLPEEKISVYLNRKLAGE